jgi:hypothetical protein
LILNYAEQDLVEEASQLGSVVLISIPQGKNNPYQGRAVRDLTELRSAAKGTTALPAGDYPAESIQEIH